MFHFGFGVLSVPYHQHYHLVLLGRLHWIVMVKTSDRLICVDVYNDTVYYEVRWDRSGYL